MEKDFDLLICDTYGHLSGDIMDKFTDTKKRDDFIREVGMKLDQYKTYLKKGKESGNALIGADVFSFTSLGESVFGRDYTKRFLVWNKKTEELGKYTDNLAFFGCAVTGSGWIFNLKEGKSFFRGEYLETENAFKTPEDVIRDMVNTFSNKGGKVLVVELRDVSKLKKVIEEEGRVFVSSEELVLDEAK